MEIKQIISKSQDGNRMEVVAENNDNLQTLHIHKGPNNQWNYYYGLEENRPIFKLIKQRRTK